ncbi:DUF1684 domain-containing protein, partial [Clavibacter capsici]|uniref:DUF1684 domain-containing protein n=1 Tax=Clavibacter capsici TaxID=1874630 RepID=UPI00374D8A66
ADGDRLQLVFADATTGRESYAPSRFLFLPRPDDAGTATLSLPSLLGRRLDVSTAFPRALAAWDADWDAARGILTVGSIPGGPSARLLELRRRS